MSDEKTPWAAPGGAGPLGGTPEEAAAAAPAQPRYGEYAPPGWVPPPPPPSPYGAPQWTPPPQPGLIPLRPLGLGDVMAAAFRVIRRNPRPTFGFALAMSAIAGVLAAGLVALAIWLAVGRVAMSSSTDVATIQAGGVLMIVLAAILTALVQIVLSAIPQAVITVEVTRGTLGERPTLRELWRRARGQVWRLIGWSVLVIVAFGIVAAAAILPLVLLGSTGLAGLGAAVLLGLLVGAGLAVLAVWLGTKLEFVVPLILVERLRIGAAMRRSWSLTRAGFWRIFGITALINVMLSIAGQIITAPISFIGTFAGGVVNPNQSAAAVGTTAIVLGIVSLVVGVVFGAITLVAQVAVPTLLYLDARMRLEGFDLVLQRHAEAKAAGEAPGDPFE